MKTLKISPSLLEQYRVVRKGLYNSTPQKLIDYMTGDYVKSPAASRGTAYHLILEHGGDSYIDFPDGPDHELSIHQEPVYKVLDKDTGTEWVFSEEAARPAIDLHKQYKDMTHEVWVDYNTKILGFDILMRMKLDGLDGYVLNEFKTTSRKPNYETYFDSLQWRANLVALPEVEKVIYSIFQLNSKNTKCTPFSFEIIDDGRSEEIINEELTGFVHWLTLNPELLKTRLFDRSKDKNPLPI